jgi:hypothetical protein
LISAHYPFGLIVAHEAVPSHKIAIESYAQAFRTRDRVGSHPDVTDYALRALHLERRDVGSDTVNRGIGFERGPENNPAEAWTELVDGN